MPGCPLETFHSQILEIGSRLFKPERDLIPQFVNGLPDKFAFFVRAGNIQSYEGALQQPNFEKLMDIVTLPNPRFGGRCSH